MHAKPAISIYKPIIAASIGNAFEWYDFTVYAFFASTIARLFFPASDPATALLFAVGTYGVGFVMRPLGAVFLGAYADTHGRRAALCLSMLLMAAGSLLNAVTPAYSQIGIAGPAMLIIARLIQGFSVGGEMGGAIAYLVEMAPANKRGLYGSWQQTSIALAIVGGSLTGVILTHLLEPAAIEAWGWRIPFFLGLLIAPAGYFIRKKVDESPVFLNQKVAREATPLHYVITQQWSGIWAGFGVSILWTITSYVLIFYMPVYAATQLNISNTSVFIASTIGGLVLLVFSPIFGWLSDFTGGKNLLLAASISIGLSVYWLFVWLTTSPNLGVLISVQCIIGILLSAYTSPIPAFLAERFPAQLRSTGISVAYNAAVVIFGGFAALIVTSLIKILENPLAPSFYVIFGSVIAIVTLITMNDKITEEP